MAADDPADISSGQPRDYTALRILGVLCLLEIGLLYVLIAVDTPLTPLVRRLLRNPGGVFALVMFVVTLLCIGMALVLTVREKMRGPTPRDPAV
jgi:hypothetical protein